MQPADRHDRSEDRYSTGQKLALTVFGCVATAIVAMPLREVLDLANMVMLFLLTVLLIAVSLGRNPAVLASVLSVLLFDLFFVPPHFSLAVSNLQYVVTFAVMLITALITGHLTAGLKARAHEAQLRERRTTALYETARQLAGALAIEHVQEIAASFVRQQLGGQVRLLLGNSFDENPGEALAIDPILARQAMLSGQPVRHERTTVDGVTTLYLPLRAPMQVRGVLAVGLTASSAESANEHLVLLEAVASLLAIAIERLHYVDVAQETQLAMTTERLRSSILSALSHDIRTPLTALAGLAESLFLIKPPLPPAALETAQTMHEQAVRLHGLVGNLLDMARLNAGEVRLRKEWQPLEEVIGSSIKLLGAPLASHRVQVTLAADLPLLCFDAVLLERVFCNLLENAAKYSPAGTPIAIDAHQAGTCVEVAVSDGGEGFPQAADPALFEMFVRGERSAGRPGSGLGLAICKAIIDAHGGSIRAANQPSSGACIRFTLPIGTPPIVDEENGA